MTASKSKPPTPLKHNHGEGQGQVTLSECWQRLIEAVWLWEPAWPLGQAPPSPNQPEVPCNVTDSNRWIFYEPQGSETNLDVCFFYLELYLSRSGWGWTTEGHGVCWRHFVPADQTPPQSLGAKSQPWMNSTSEKCSIQFSVILIASTQIQFFMWL